MLQSDCRISLNCIQCSPKLPNIVRHTMSAKAEKVSSSIFQRLGFPVVKREQVRVIIGILERDVFVMLPTGFGKSLCFQCLPLLYDQLFPNEAHSIFILVVTPLTAIMKDQASSI